jgi:hypothetical protein
MLEHFPPERIRQLFDAAIHLELFKPDMQDALLASLPRSYVADLEHSNHPGQRLFKTLTALNQTGRIDNIVPLKVWLDNAALLSGGRERAEVFRPASDDLNARVIPDEGRREPQALNKQFHELPSPPRADPSFVGREDELRQLYEGLVTRASGSARIAPVVVSGLGGIGKTALAIEFLERHQHHFPAGILWADLGTNRDDGDHRGNTMSSEVHRVVLRRWLGELGEPSDAGDVETLAGSVRRLLAERAKHLGPCLVVLDHVDTPATFSLLRDILTDASLLVTSRLNELDEVSWVKLGGLSRDAALDYLRTVVGDDRTTDFESVLEYVDGHPLALRLVARRFGANQKVDAAELLQRLREQRPTKKKRGGLVRVPQSLADCFRVSIAGVPGETKAFLAACASQAPTSFSLAAIDYTSGVCNLERSRRILEELDHEGLVETIGDERFRIHRLLRDYLRQEHRYDGFGFFRPTWEPTSLAWILMRTKPQVSAGQAVYDLRQEAWHLRFVAQHTDEPELGREWEGVRTGIARRASSTDDAGTAGNRLIAFRQHLHGTDLSKLKIRNVLLDGIDLSSTRMDGADLSGTPLRWFGHFRHALLATLVAVAFFAFLGYCLGGARSIRG